MAISIKEPCNEDWNKMTSSERGAHCKLCALEVIDFTNKTPFEIKGILAEEFTTGKRVCGRITNYQLDQINDDFFRWKNERESFRAVWIFSLLAVFGLTLFSCQHTPTREMIDQLNIEASVALQQETVQVEMKDSVEVSTKKDSISRDVMLPWYPEIVTYTGVIPNDWGRVDLSKWITCEIVLGDFILTGSVTTTPKKEVNDFLLASPSLDPVPKAISGPRAPKPNPSNERSDQPIQAISSGGERKFEACIYPNPVESDSCLYINALEPVSLDISLFRKGENVSFRHGQSNIQPGKHKIDLRLHLLEAGNYQLQLLTIGQLSVLDFEVQAKGGS